MSEAESLLAKNIFWNRFKSATNIILIAWVLIIGAYFIYKVAPEMETFKTLNHDVCAYCMEKTGAICSKNTFHAAISDTPSIIPTLNLTAAVN